jgi:hypothetical protein
MAEKLNAEGRIRMAIGDQFVQIQILQDQVDGLTQQLADAVTKIAELEKASAPASETPKAASA